MDLLRIFGLIACAIGLVVFSFYYFATLNPSGNLNSKFEITEFHCEKITDTYECSFRVNE